MPVEDEEEDKPVSIASLRSRFENLAAGNPGIDGKGGSPRNDAGSSRINRPVGGITALRPVRQDDPPEIKVGHSQPDPSSTPLNSNPDQSLAEAIQSNYTPSQPPQSRLKPPPPPKPSSISTRSVSPSPSLEPDSRNSVALFPASPASSSTAPFSRPDSSLSVSPSEATTSVPSKDERSSDTLALAEKGVQVQEDMSVDGDEPDGPSPSVKAMLAKFGGGSSGTPGDKGSITGQRDNVTAGPSTTKRKPPPSIPTLGTPQAKPILSSRPPDIRRTSTDGQTITSLPLSPPLSMTTQSMTNSQTASPQSTPVLNSTSSPVSPSLRPISPASSSTTTRAPSPKPPEPDRSSKPPRAALSAAPDPPSDEAKGVIHQDRPSEVSAPSMIAPPALPTRKTSEPSETPDQRPPIPPNRPKLASVASAVMAAQALSGPPRLPARDRGQSVGSRDTTKPPTRSTPNLPANSASVIPALRSRPPVPERPFEDDAEDMVDTPIDDYHPPPPPTRNIQPGTTLPTPPRRQDTKSAPPTAEGVSEEEDDADEPNHAPGITGAAKRMLEDYPDSTHANRRPPRFMPDMKITGTAHSTSFAMHGRYVCTGSHVVRVFDTLMSDQPIHYVELHETGLEFRIKENKVTAMCFRPAVSTSEEGRYLCCGTKDGHLWELDIKTGEITDTRPSIHSSAVIHIFRYKQSIMSLEEHGKLHIFEIGLKSDNKEDISKVPQLCRTMRVTEKFNFAKLVCGRLWTSSGPAHRSTTSAAAAKGPTIRIYEPCVTGSSPTGKTVWATEWTGAVTCATILPLKPDKVYLGHEGGYISIWDTEDLTCLQVLKISTSDILSLEGVGEKLWAGNRKGQIHVYDVSTRPWTATNLWTAHPEHSVHQLAIDPWSIEQTGRFVLWSLGKDSLRAWDGLLSVDWIDSRMEARQADYSTFRDIKTLICSWNIDSAKPHDLAGSDANTNFLPDLLGSVDDPEIIVFGFQEVIPLTDKKLTAKTLLFGGKNKESGSTADKVSHAYRQWIDKLASAVRFAYPDTPYVKIHSESLVGLCTCVFVKNSERENLRDIDVCTVKRGIGGIYGNKGAIVARLVLQDTSICFINVHLAAGQSAKASRTADLSAIMEDKAILPVTDPLPFINGGDGAAILDHELVILNGDLNYRIDQRRENVISSIQAGDLPYLLEHDQLRKEMSTNHAFRLRTFSESPIHFPPTYKYNTGTNEYDTSEKRRIPAWCDRILYTKSPSMTCLHYKSYSTTVSDHKPVSAGFRMTVKAVDPAMREVVRREVRAEWAKEEARILESMEKAYLDMC